MALSSFHSLSCIQSGMHVGDSGTDLLILMNREMRDDDDIIFAQLRNMI